MQYLSQPSRIDGLILLRKCKRGMTYNHLTPPPLPSDTKAWRLREGNCRFQNASVTRTTRPLGFQYAVCMAINVATQSEVNISVVFKAIRTTLCNCLDHRK